MNSPSTNLAMHYPSGPAASRTNRQQRQSLPRPAFNPITNQYDPPPPQTRFRPQMRSNSNGSSSQITSYPTQSSAAVNGVASTSDADLLLNLHSPYNTSSSQAGSSPAFPHAFTNTSDPQSSSFNDLAGANWNYANLWNPLDFSQNASAMQPFGDLMIESQDVDMNMLGLDMMPWFDNFSSGGDVLFGSDGAGSAGVSGSAGAGEATSRR